MKSEFTAFFHREWQRYSLWQWLLFPLSLLYQAVTQCRYAYYRVIAPAVIPVPVIVVGNLYLGGTGKTPLIIALAQALKSQGYNPGIISRGYGADYQGEVTLDDSANKVGDEPLLMHRRTGCPVFVHPRRTLAAQNLCKAYPNCNVILSDDGLQHYALSRNIEIVVFDAQKGLGNGLCLPAGPLRESTCRLNRVSIGVFNTPHDDANVATWWPKNIPAYTMRLLGSQLFPLHSGQSSRPLSEFAGQTVHAVAGIGNPDRFFHALQQQGLRVIPHRFPDHHAYREQDFAHMQDYPIVMTEKDAVKCQTMAMQNGWYLPVDATLPDAFYNHVIQQLKAQSLE